MACSACAADQYVYFNSLSNEMKQWIVCPNFCTTLYHDCNDTIVASTSKKVSESFPNSVAFCHQLLSAIPGVVPSIPDVDTTHSCFDPTKPACTTDDMEYFYTDCIAGENALMYIWNNDRCSAGYKLPPRKNRLVCPIECEKGKYLPLGSNYCRDCPAGTYSLGGGYTLHTFDPLPTRFLEFTTWCENTEDASHTPNFDCGWKGRENSIDANIQGKDLTRSILQMTGNLENNGEISFLLEVDTEAFFDVPTFYIDGEVQDLSKSTDHPAVVGPKKHTFPVAAGYHTFQWVYTKDVSLSHGADTVWLIEISLTNLLQHNNFCTDCPAGYYRAEGGPVDCLKCSANTYSRAGASFCASCDINLEYSFPGSTNCTQRPVCTERDYYSWYTDCTTSPGGVHSRSQHFDWIAPHVCRNGVNLPLYKSSVPFAPCNPGYHLSSTGTCQPCASGFSSSGGQSQCVPCLAGNYAPKEMIIDYFHSWPLGAHTECVWGECEDGWILAGDSVTTGGSHEGMVAMDFTISVEVTAEPFGFLSYDYDLICSEFCWLEVYSGGELLAGSWDKPYQTGLNERDIPLSTGHHNLTWSYIVLSGTSNISEYASVHRITIEGVSTGGAARCLPCPAGSYSADWSVSCTHCQKGHFTSTPGSRTCEACLPNTFADSVGQETCLPCGSNTVTPPGSDSCDLHGCTLISPLKTIILSDLGRTPTMFGPATYGDVHYLVHPCRAITDLRCPGLDKPTFACRYNDKTGQVLDFGRVQGYHFLPDKSVVLEFTQGDQPLCGAHETEKAVPYTLNVTLICDESAGIGAPSIVDGKNPLAGDSHPESCHANLVWRTSHACHSCLPEDYETLISACDGETQTIRFVWKEPKLCQGGVELPPSQIKLCGTNHHCNIGQFDFHGNCTSCPSNTYSLGTGTHYEHFKESNIAPFETYCDAEECSVWSVENTKLTSGSGNSTLVLDASFHLGANSFRFTYSGLGYGHFVVTVDGRKVVDIVTSLPFEKSYVLAVPPGEHQFVWNYLQSPLPYPHVIPGYVRLESITIQNGENVAACQICPPGYQVPASKDECTLCPANTYSSATHTCKPCPNNQWRLPGEFHGTGCHPYSGPCTDEDYLQVTPGVTLSSKNTFCGDNGPFAITLKQLPLLPQLCADVPLSEQVSNNCLSCPIGTMFAFNTGCVPCTGGTVLTKSTGSSTPSCHDPPEHYVPVLEKHYFDSTELVTGQELPAGWSSYCTGTCGTTGWTRKGTSVISGIHYGSVTSVLTLSVTIHATRGLQNTVEFLLRAYPSPISVREKKRSLSSDESGFSFFINDKVQKIDHTFHEEVSNTQLYTVDLVPPGSLSNYRQENLTLSWIFTHVGDEVAPVLELSDVVVRGTKEGIALKAVPCPLGHIAKTTDDGYKRCIPCAASTYQHGQLCVKCPSHQASVAGSYECRPCGTGTHVAPSGLCETNCQYNLTSDMKWIDPTKPAEAALTFDLTDLATSNIEWRDENGQNWIFHVNVCQRLPAIFYCTTRDGVCPDVDAYAFLQKSGEDGLPYALGQQLEFLPLLESLDEHDGESTFSITLTGGEYQPPFCKNVITTITFVCEAELGALQLESAPTPPLGGKTISLCKYDFKWATSRACRKCIQGEDWELAYGDCLGGERTVSWRKVNPDTLCSTIDLPPTSSVSCDTDTLPVPIVWGYVVGIGAVVILLIVAIVAFVMCYRIRDVSARYVTLEEQLKKGPEAL